MSLTDAERERAIAARQYVHETTCPRGHLDPAPCRACPSGRGIVDALRLLDERPCDAKGARRVLHDVVCMSGCGPESDHADRTQAKAVAALRKFRAEEARGQCTPEDPCPEGWTSGYTLAGVPVALRCEGCGRKATPVEAEAEQERRYDASLPDMTGYAEQ